MIDRSSQQKLKWRERRPGAELLLSTETAITPAKEEATGAETEGPAQ